MMQASCQDWDLTIRGLYGEGSEARGTAVSAVQSGDVGPEARKKSIHSLTQAAQQIAGHERTMREIVGKERHAGALQDSADALLGRIDVCEADDEQGIHAPLFGRRGMQPAWAMSMRRCLRWIC